MSQSTLRPPRPLRSLRQAVPDRTEVQGRTEVLDDQPHIQAIEQLLPQIASESEEAAKPARVAFYYYRKKRTGRRCSCFTAETSPDGYCQICYGAGFVGGWDMHGCRTEVIDTTAPDLKIVNLKVDYNIRPATFVLTDGTRQGFLETHIDLIRNINVTQFIQLVVGNQKAGSSVKAFIRAPSEVLYVPLNDQSLEARLGNNRIFIRIEMQRNNTAIPSPRLSQLMLRYQLIPIVHMYADMNLAEESFELGDLGFTDAFSQLNLYVPPSFDHLNNEDFLIRMSDRKRFKVTRFERNAVSEILLSHRVMARLLIPGTDSLISFP